MGGPVHVDHDLVDGDIIETDETGAGEMLVFHTPGHSNGSISLLLQSERALFSGDAIPVAGDLPVYDNAALSVKSVKRLRGLPASGSFCHRGTNPAGGMRHTREWIRLLSTSN